MGNVYLLQDIENGYEVDYGDIGIYRTRAKAVKAAHKDAENRNRRIQSRPRPNVNRDELVIQVHEKQWSDETGDFEWTGDWVDWGWYIISAFELDEMPEKAVEE